MYIIHFYNYSESFQEKWLLNIDGFHNNLLLKYDDKNRARFQGTNVKIEILLNHFL